MYKNKLFFLSLALLFIVQWGCIKDVTKDYLSDNPSLIGVECLFSSQKPWEVFVYKTHKLNDRAYKEDLPKVNSIRIIEDGSRIINLTFDSKKKAFVSPEYPKEGHTYKLELKVPNSPLITAEDYVPSSVDISDYKVDFNKQPFFVDLQNGSDLYYKTTFNIKKNGKKAQFFRVNVALLKSEPSYFKMLPTTITGLRNKNIPEEIIQKLIDGTKEGQLSYDNFRDIFSDSVLEKILSTEIQTQWKTKYDNLINPFIFSLKNIFPMILKKSDIQPSDLGIKSRDVVFLNNAYFRCMLIGNLKYYNDQPIEIYADPSNKSKYEKIYVSDDPEEVSKHSGKDFYTTKLELFSLSNNLSRYMQDVVIQYNNKSEMFAPTIMVKSNVNNGVGVFGGLNKSVVTLYHLRKEYKF